MSILTFAAPFTGALNGHTLTGTWHTFGQRALVDGTWHEFAPTAFDRVLADATRDIFAFWNHDERLILGRLGNGTLSIAHDRVSATYEINLPPTSYAADLEALSAADYIAGNSFAILPGKTRAGRAPDGRPVLLHTDVDRLIEVSPVSLPAFKSTSLMLNSEQFAERVVTGVNIDSQIALAHYKARY